METRNDNSSMLLVYFVYLHLHLPAETRKAEYHLLLYKVVLGGRTGRSWLVGMQTVTSTSTLLFLESEFWSYLANYPFNLTLSIASDNRLFSQQHWLLMKGKAQVLLQSKFPPKMEQYAHQIRKYFNNPDSKKRKMLGRSGNINKTECNNLFILFDINPIENSTCFYLSNFTKLGQEQQKTEQVVEYL